MKVLPLNLTQKLNFKSNYTSKRSNLYTIGSLNHETYLFREPKTDEFVQNYMRKELSAEPKITIVSGACSSGDEIMSYAVMLDDIINKLNISAFDIDEDIIKEAKKGKVYVSANSMEGHLLGKLSVSKFKQRCARQFHKYFKPTGVANPPEQDSYMQWLALLNPIKYQKEMKRLSLYEYRLNQEVMEKIVFQCGDIEHIEDMYDKESINILLFRNAMYHILCEYDENENRVELQNAQKIADSIAQKLYRVMKENGLVVFGEKEHKQGIKNKTIENAMLNNGFLPVNIAPNDLDKVLIEYIPGYYDENRHYHIWKKEG